MLVEQIDTRIEEGKVIERETGILRRAIVDLARLDKVIVTESDVQRVVDFVVDYIEHAPALMSIIEEAGATHDAQSDIQPLLDATGDYFLSQDDIIPDRYGLVGLLDDAYLAHRLMEAISDRHRSRSDESLFPVDAREINSFVRRLIGAPFAGMLDEYAAATLDKLSGERDINQISTALARLNLSSGPDPIWGNARAVDITAAHLTAMGSF